MDPLVQQVFLNASARQSRANREARAIARYRQARGVKEHTKADYTRAPWNRMNVKMGLYLCYSVKEKLSNG